MLINQQAFTNFYTKNLHDTVSKTYKKPIRNKVNNINYKAKTPREKWNIDDRLQQMQEARPQKRFPSYFII